VNLGDDVWLKRSRRPVVVVVCLHAPFLSWVVGKNEGEAVGRRKEKENGGVGRETETEVGRSKQLNEER
jgi:hypothetical protein